MGVLYLAALIIGLGTILVQLFMGGDGGGEAEAGAAELDHGLDHDVVHPGGAAVEHAGGLETGFLPIFLSLRFWVFGLLAFGMVGSVLHFVDLAGPLLTAGVAVVMGFSSGTLASWVFRALTSQHISSGAHETDPVGQVGRVMVAVRKQGCGKVRIQLRGQTLDLLATTDDAELLEGEQVLIEEMREGQAHVSKAPAAFLARDGSG